LEAAHRAALIKDEENIARERVHLRKTNLANVRRNLDIRDKLADEFTASLAQTIALFHKLQEVSDKARRSWPHPTNWPDDMIDTASQIKREVLAEIARLSSTPGRIGDERSFPGASVPNIDFEWQPNRIEPFADKIKRGSDNLWRAIEGHMLEKEGA